MTAAPANAPKRFYKAVTVQQVDAGWHVVLDARTLRTPAGAALCLPTMAMAERVAAEWDTQGETIDLNAMLATRLANVVVDRALAAREAMLEQALDHVGTDLILFRDPTDQRLFQAQEAGFAPVLEWARTSLRADLPLAEGLMPAPLSSQAFAAISEALWPSPEGTQAHRLALWRLTLVSAAAPLLGSTLLALAIAAGRLCHADAFGLSRLEEEHQARLWGRDAEADARAAEIEREVGVYAAMLAALPR